MFRTSPQLRAAYLLNRTQDLAVLQKSLKENSIEEFHRIGHQLSGNAANFGFPELETIGSQMEDLKPEEISSRAATLLTAFEQWVARANSQNNVLA